MSQKLKFFYHSIARFTFLRVFIITSLVLLNACSSTTPNNQHAAIPTNGVNASLKEQGHNRLQTFAQWIKLMQQYGGNVTAYQQTYSYDQQNLYNAQNASHYQTALTILTTHINSIQIPAMKTESHYLYNHLSNAVNTYGNAHVFHDTYNNVNYAMGYEYNSQNGILGPLWTEADMQSASTVNDYQTIVEELNMYTYNFNEMLQNTLDHTPSTQTHHTDLDLLQHYNATTGKALVVSLEEETMRVYNNGQLQKIFQTTTGQPDLATPPGNWHIESKQTNVLFKSHLPKSDPNWYPDTKIAHAMQYHSNGYFIHEAWWRDIFGPGTQFPHQDPSNLEDSGIGSHGCINVSLPDATWIENYVDVFTPVIVY